MRVLALTKIFPHRLKQSSNPHIRRQCVALAKICQLRVCALIPWFPGAALVKRSSKADVSEVPRHDTLFGLDVSHPRVLYLPRVPSLSGLGYALSIAPELLRLRKEIDVILATFAYPDGVAAVAVGHLLGIPTVVQAIGSDIDVGAENAAARSQVRWAFQRAAGVIAVSSALAEKCVALGARPETTKVIITGVDRTAFAPRSREAARAKLGLPADAKLILYVGTMSEPKGALDALKAFELLHLDGDVRLAFVGDGPLLGQLRQRAAGRRDVITTGQVDGETVSEWITACDLLTLPSYHEGTPNVVLEAMSSGRPVVATRVGGIPDVVSSPVYGELVPPGAIADLARAYARVLSQPHDPELIAACPSLYGWDQNARLVMDVLRAAAPVH